MIWLLKIVKYNEMGLITELFILDSERDVKFSAAFLDACSKWPRSYEQDSQRSDLSTLRIHSPAEKG